MLKDLYNKEKPKKPHYEYGICFYGEADYDLWICPNCGKSYVADFGIYERCTHCGQVIDWTPYEEKK